MYSTAENIAMCTVTYVPSTIQCARTHPSGGAREYVRDSEAYVDVVTVTVCGCKTLLHGMDGWTDGDDEVYAEPRWNKRRGDRTDACARATEAAETSMNVRGGEHCVG